MTTLRRVATLAEFLLARIAEDEVGGSTLGGTSARVLAECEAKRRIVAWHRDNIEPDYTLQILAAIYAAHADYRYEWRP